MRGGWALLAAWSATACTDELILPPEGHVLLHIDTDAPVAPPAGTIRDAQAPPPLFDRVLIEVFRSGESEPCVGCVAELDLTQDVLEAGGSLALVPNGPASGLVIRARMFFAARRLDDQVAPEASVEVVARLPDVAEESSVEAGVFLPVEAVGFPIGTLGDPVEAERGPFGPSRVGSWPGAQRLGCAEPTPPGAVCVPGGAFWMGHPLAIGNDADTATDRQRLVVLQPFFMDVREATVGSFRQTGLSSSYVNAWSGKRTGGDIGDYADWCTYTAVPDPEREALPLACIGWEGAQAYCEARGGQLPTEAQFEYVSGSLESRPYVWGSEDPTCDDAIWSRGANFLGFQFVCTASLPEGDIGGPLALPPDPQPESLAPPRARDVARFANGAVFDLAGNLSEWARDRYQRQDEACWFLPNSNVFYDPVCDRPGVAQDANTLRGGNWRSRPESLRAASRLDASSNVLEAGVRCVWPATPAP